MAVYSAWNPPIFTVWFGNVEDVGMCQGIDHQNSKCS